MLVVNAILGGRYTIKGALCMQVKLCCSKAGHLEWDTEDQSSLCGTNTPVLTGFKLTLKLQLSSCLTTRKDMTICETGYRLLMISIYSITVNTPTYGF